MLPGCCLAATVRRGPAAAALAMKLHQRAAGQVIIPTTISVSPIGQGSMAGHCNE